LYTKQVLKNKSKPQIPGLPLKRFKPKTLKNMSSKDMKNGAVKVGNSLKWLINGQFKQEDTLLAVRQVFLELSKIIQV
jgi:antitoxin component YwqK of YwqJK toxin-antitoxin module